MFSKGASVSISSIFSLLRKGSSVAGHNLGVQNLRSEFESVRLPIEGRLPNWLSGDLVRNGPGQFDVGGKTLNHWFDGFSAVHRFAFSNGEVSYSCKFLQSQAFIKARESKKISSVEFGTKRAMGLIDRIKNIFQAELSDNSNGSIICLDGRWLALTETPHVQEFNLANLNTVGPVIFDDNVQFHVTTAHPQWDFDEAAIYNVTVTFGRTCSYQLVKQLAGEKRRRVVSRIDSPAPAYLHSFGMTKKYAIICEHPLRLSFPELIFSGKPYIECYHWRDQVPTNFIVVSKESGEVVRRFEGEPGFSFHKINAFDREGEIVLDLISYPDSKMIEVLYLRNMREDKPELVGQARRFCFNLNSGKMTSEPLAESGLEFPQINYRARSGKQYDYCYGSGTTSMMSDNITSADFLNALRKIDINTGATKLWTEAGCYPGEPVFVPRPDAAAWREDDGVLLSIVLDVPNERSFLLVLDAATMQEMARLVLPQPVPFTFHGLFVGKENESTIGANHSEKMT